MALRGPVLVAALSVLALSGCALPPEITPASRFTPNAPLLRPFADGLYWVLESDMEYDRGDNWPPIVVPRGFVTDLTSVPRAFQSIVSAVGPYTRAAILHDYLFWTQGCTRDQADNIIYYAMHDSGVPHRKAWQIYQGLRAGGRIAFASNKAEREKGLPKFLPREGTKYWPDVHTKSWAKVRGAMVAEGVKDPPLGETPYCTLGGNRLPA